ncbi:putative extracellular protein [Limosilactobacillus frumenti DSM 13145]|uniref:Putative extracellular protein n=2 Tax=Limosilactobacillus frumenti TaxID=104955 RepID=A0A0R1P1M6_9LACO|nr:putative extracellular protein [Limosilactobacillus frumenti DSM 13145]
MGYSAKKRKVTTYTANRDVVISHNIERYQANNENGTNSVVNNDINMMPTYKDIVENDIIAKQARKNLPKKLRAKYSTSDIQDVVSAKVSQQSLVMDVKVETKSPKDSVQIVNAVSQSFKQQLPKLQPGSGQVTLLARANKNNVNSTTKPSAKKYAIVGLALGGLLGLIISLVIATVRTFGK